MKNNIILLVIFNIFNFPLSSAKAQNDVSCVTLPDTYEMTNNDFNPTQPWRRVSLFGQGACETYFTLKNLGHTLEKVTCEGDRQVHFITTETLVCYRFFNGEMTFRCDLDFHFETREILDPVVNPCNGESVVGVGN